MKQNEGKKPWLINISQMNTKMLTKEQKKTKIEQEKKLKIFACLSTTL